MSRARGPRTRICGLCVALEAAAELKGDVAEVAAWPLTPARLAREFRDLLKLVRSPDQLPRSLALRRAPHRLRGVPDRVEIRALNVAGDRWSLILAKLLREGPMREIEIKRDLARLCAGSTGKAPSSGQLTARLAQMTSDGLCKRTRHREWPPRVTYELTDAGAALVPLVEAIEAWGHEWIDGA